MRRITIGVLAVAVASGAAASPDSPYAGQEAREIKALSAEEIDDYLDGRGMGLAKAAELNHYPGPRHVLDLADELGLDEEQRRRTQAIYDAMREKAVALGERLVEKEGDLDRRFAGGTIDADALGALLSEIGALQGELRAVHLLAHLEQRAVLTSAQIEMYDRLRGYGDGPGAGHRHSHGMAHE